MLPLYYVDRLVFPKHNSARDIIVIVSYVSHNASPERSDVSKLYLCPQWLTMDIVIIVNLTPIKHVCSIFRHMYFDTYQQLMPHDISITSRIVLCNPFHVQWFNGV